MKNPLNLLSSGPLSKHLSTPLSGSSSGRLAALALAALLASACSSNPGKGDRPENPFKTAADSPGGPQSPLNDRELRQQAAQLYRRAREALENTDYTVAIQRYDALIARYPFSDYSTQAEMEKIYAQYKAFQSDEAVTAADRFLRAHPRNVYADYVMYLKGVTDFERDNGLLDSVMSSTSKRDIGNQRRSFEDFAALLQRYPKSRYAGDARRRMLYSRNRIADHELSVAEFYVTRGAYVAAAKRASDIVTEYPGAPATADALKILQRSYARIGLQNEAKDTAAMIAMNSDKVVYSDAPKPGVIHTNTVSDSAEKQGWMSRLFSSSDSSKVNTQRGFVIGNGPEVPPPPTGATVAPLAAPTAAPAAAAATAPAAQQQTAPAAPQAPAAATAPATQADTGVAADSDKKPGLMSRFAGVFGRLDSSKPENQRTFVIGDGPNVPPSPTAGAAATAPAGRGAAAPATSTATAASASATTLNGGSANSNVHMSVEYPDATTAPAAAPVPKNATQPEDPQAKQDKPGFFTWFAGLFSGLDRTEHDPAPTPVPAPSPAPKPADVAPGGATNADTTK